MGDVIRTGPLFDGRAELAMGRYCATVEEALAQSAENEIGVRLGEVIQVSTGYYESRIHTERASDGLVVTDTPVVYGPWLEGVGSRNQTTRFKGYQTFRLVTQQLDHEAGPAAESLMVTGGYLEALNA